MKKIVLIVLSIAFTGFGCKTYIIKEKPVPKNIILMIGDGMGYNQIAAMKYFHGIDTTVFEKFPHIYAMSTYPATTYAVEDTSAKKYTQQNGYDSQRAWYEKGYLGKGYTCSGAAATAMATGYKTAKKAIGVDMDGEALENIVERAAKIGKSTGVVTSVQISHATPASFVVHNSNRDNYEAMTRDFVLGSYLTIAMGCGHPFYNANSEKKDTAYTYKYVGGKDLWEGLLNGSSVFGIQSPTGDSIVKDIDHDGNPDPWTLVTDSLEFVRLMYEKNPPKRVLGVAKNITTLQQKRGGPFSAEEYEPSIPAEILNKEAYSVPFNSQVPDLYQMAIAALNVLNRNDKGFFLMIEGGAIDKAGHDLSLGRIIEETHDLNTTIDSVVAWIEKFSSWDKTLVIVTGDHETGYLVSPDYPEEEKTWDSDTIIHSYPLINEGKGVMPGAKLLYDNHTNQLIPIYLKGKGSEYFLQYAINEDIVWGLYLDNTDIAKVMFDLWSE